MNWSELYPIDKEPTTEEISDYVGNDLWNQLDEYLKKEYSSKPKVEYSRCSMVPGWNVKHKKNGKALCTLYPQSGFFICLVTVKNDVEAILPLTDKYIRDLYDTAGSLNGSRWLMIEVKSERILDDIKELIAYKLRK